jgi:aminopeptidase N
MADKMVNPAFPGVDHSLNFMVNHYPGAYAVDRSEGANAIRQPLANLNQAGQLYGSIIYHKAPIMMRQLELIVGEEGLRDGLRQYLRDFAFSNASWPELIAILDERTDSDLAAWSEVWVNTPGRPEFVLEGTGRERRLLQVDPQREGRIWPQQFDLLSLYAETVETNSLLATEAAIPMPAPVAQAAPVAQLFNADGRGYGLFPADAASLQAWGRLRGVQRGAALVNAYEQLLEGRNVAPPEYLQSLLGIIQREQDPLLLELALGQLQYVYTSLLDDSRRAALTPLMEEALWETMLAQTDSSGTKLLFRYFAALASSPERLRQLYQIWSGELAPERLLLDEEDLASLAQVLAIRLPEKSGQIMARQIADTANPDRRRRLEFLAPSVAADIAVRDAFFESLADERNRQTESWVLDALRNLHHPARLAQSQQYLLPSLELLQEIQVTGDIFFPSGWLQATLGNYHAAAQAQLVRQFLEQRPDYNPQLRMKILQAADPLLRAARLRQAASQ